MKDNVELNIKPMPFAHLLEIRNDLASSKIESSRFNMREFMPDKMYNDPPKNIDYIKKCGAPVCLAGHMYIRMYDDYNRNPKFPAINGHSDFSRFLDFIMLDTSHRATLQQDRMRELFAPRAVHNSNWRLILRHEAIAAIDGFCKTGYPDWSLAAARINPGGEFQ